MKNIILFIAFGFIMSAMNAQTWYNNMDDAKKESLRTNKPILLTFCKSASCYSGLIDRDSWTKPEVINALNSFVLLKIDMQFGMKYRNRYKTWRSPFIITMDANEIQFGYQIIKEIGANKNRLIAFLEDYSIDLSIVNDEIKADIDINHTLRISEAYMQLSLQYQDISHALLAASEAYLKKAKKKVGRSDEEYQRLHQLLKSMRK